MVQYGVPCGLLWRPLLWSVMEALAVVQYGGPCCGETGFMLSCLWEGQRTQEVAEATGSQTSTPVSCTRWPQGW